MATTAATTLKNAALAYARENDRAEVVKIAEILACVAMVGGPHIKPDPEKFNLPRLRAFALQTSEAIRQEAQNKKANDKRTALAADRNWAAIAATIGAVMDSMARK